MKRLEKAYLQYPNGIVLSKGNVLISDTYITDCCPYFLDCGADDLDEDTKVGNYGHIKGCRGITCEKCWDKEYIANK